MSAAERGRDFTAMLISLRALAGTARVEAASCRPEIYEPAPGAQIGHRVQDYATCYLPFRAL